MATFEGTMELLENGDPQANQSSLEESVHEDIRERLERRNMLFRMKAVEEAIGPLVDQVWMSVYLSFRPIRGRNKASDILTL
jgi:hypothetical protein